MTTIHLDPLYEDAAVYLVAISRVSPTALQRKFRIGLSRALRLIQQMEQEGLIASVSQLASPALFPRERSVKQNKEY